MITTEAAALWTDGRYFIQAEQQLSKDWTLMKMGLPECPEVCLFFCSLLHRAKCIERADLQMAVHDTKAGLPYRNRSIPTLKQRSRSTV